MRVGQRATLAVCCLLAFALLGAGIVAGWLYRAVRAAALSDQDTVRAVYVGMRFRGIDRSKGAPRLAFEVATCSAAFPTVVSPNLIYVDLKWPFPIEPPYPVAWISRAEWDRG